MPSRRAILCWSRYLRRWASDCARTCTRSTQSPRPDQASPTRGEVPGVAGDGTIDLRKALPELCDRCSDALLPDIGCLHIDRDDQTQLLAVRQPVEEFLGFGVARER